MYNFDEVKSEASGNKYMKHGVHKVAETTVELKSLSGENYTGDAIDVQFTNDKGETTNWRIFPFTYNAKVQKYKGGVATGPKSEKEQLESWLGSIKHVFTKAMGEDGFKKAMSKVTDFKSLAKGLQAGIKSFKQDYYIMLVDKNGYAKLPTTWTGGYASIDADKLDFDPAKHGKKDAPANAEKPTTSSDQFDMFADPTPVGSTSEATTSEAEADDLPW